MEASLRVLVCRLPSQRVVCPPHGPHDPDVHGAPLQDTQSCSFVIIAIHEAGVSTDEVLRRVARRQPLQPHKGTSPNPDRYAPQLSGGRTARSAPSTRSRKGRMDSRTGESPSAPAASARPSGEDDGAETARLCDELLRWSSALEGAERQLGVKDGPGGFGRRGAGGNGASTRRAAKVPDDDVIEEVSQPTKR